MDSESLDLFGGSVKIGVVQSDSQASIQVQGGSINARNDLTISATSIVKTEVTTAPDEDSDSEFSDSTASDAAITISIIDSTATVDLTGGTLLAGGAANITASNEVNVTTDADGTAGDDAEKNCCEKSST